MAIHDIRNQMPKFDANYFPPYEYRPFPRMMVNKETGKPYRDKANRIVIVNDEHAEKLFLAEHCKPEEKPEPKAIEIPVAAPAGGVSGWLPRQQFEAVTPAEADKLSNPVREKRKYTRKLPKDLK
jgi:hypothetical protein